MTALISWVLDLVFTSRVASHVVCLPKGWALLIVSWRRKWIWINAATANNDGNKIRWIERRVEAAWGCAKVTDACLEVNHWRVTGEDVMMWFREAGRHLYDPAGWSKDLHPSITSRPCWHFCNRQETRKQQLSSHPANSISNLVRFS